MGSLVLTMIGDDRAGLVNAVARVVAEHGGNWEHSQMTELAGKFAGIAQISVPDARVESLASALQPLQGLLDVAVQHADPDEAAVSADAQHWTLELLGTDRVGIISDVTAALAEHGVSIDALSTTTREAPMAGGLLFEAIADVRVPSGADIDALRTSLESIANELLVDIEFDPLPTR